MKIKIILTLLLGGVLFSTLQAQPGCTDPQASNFDSNATQNDGSCLYSYTEYAMDLVVELDNDLEENSGLAFFNNHLWTINDAGGEDKIYRIDTLTGEISKTVIIATADNTDWEDLAESPTHVFIGDFGNNDGDRTDLRIYRVSKSDLENNTVVNAELISFSFADQTDFEPNNNDHNFDCEAFFFLGGYLHLFSKNWDDYKTKHYRIPATPGVYVAQIEETFNAQCLVTGADISPDGTVALISYTNTGLNIMWLLYDYQGTDFFSGNKRRVNLGNVLLNGQTEGIVFSQDTWGYIGAENFQSTNQRLASFGTRQWLTNSTAISNTFDAIEIDISPNPFTTQFTIHSEEIMSRVEVVSLAGKSCFSEKIRSNFYTLEAQNLPEGIYLIKISTPSGLKIKKIVKNNP